MLTRVKEGGVSWPRMPQTRMPLANDVGATLKSYRSTNPTTHCAIDTAAFMWKIMQVTLSI
jgi:hypothetical protein